MSEKTRTIQVGYSETLTKCVTYRCDQCPVTHEFDLYQPERYSPKVSCIRNISNNAYAIKSRPMRLA